MTQLDDINYIGGTPVYTERDEIAISQYMQEREDISPDDIIIFNDKNAAFRFLTEDDPADALEDIFLAPDNQDMTVSELIRWHLECDGRFTDLDGGRLLFCYEG